MKKLFIILFAAAVWAEDPVLTPPREGNSGCNVKRHLGLSDKEEFLKFHDNLAKLVEEGKKKEISAIINYPLRFSSKKEILVSNKEIFLDSYDLVFNEKIKNAIRNQDRNEFFCNSQGVMYGKGAVWVNNFNKQKKLKVVTINQK